jgi:osmotically-inducible protein OsmY
MVRTLLRVVLLIIIVAAVAAFFFGYRMANRDNGEPNFTVGTTGRTDRTVDVGTARETGAEIAEKVAVGANAAERFAESAALTAKIKSKMALDDTVEAARIDVDTSGSVVTLSGTVDSQAERERALQLARETEGVTSVVDALKIR